MPSAPPRRPRSHARPAQRLAHAACVLVTGAAALAGAAPALAAPLQCEASALRGTVLGAGALEPVVVNRGASACTTAAAGGAAAAQALGALPISAGVLGASTFVTPAGTPNEKQAALAQGGLADLRIKALPTLPITLPTATIPAEVAAVTIPTPAVLTSLPVVGLLLPATLTFDLTTAVTALLPSGQLPNVDVVQLQAALAFAGANCQGGRATPFGVTQVAGLKVLGQELPTDAPANQTLNLIDTANVDLNQLDPALIPLPLGLSPLINGLLGPLLATVQSAVVAPLIAALPPISIPATVADIRLTAASQTLQDGTLVQQGPRLQVSIAGQSVADLVIGEARVGTAGVDCTPAPAPVVAPPTSAADLALACTTRRLVLVDVLRQGNRVKLLGAADRRLAGQTVKLRVAATGRIVASAKVAADGSFTAFAPLPGVSTRNTNAARYQAVLGSERSLDLKLARRMVVSSLTAKGGKVTIKGRVILPLARPLASITLTRRVSCRRNEVVRRFTPQADGTFSITVAAPAGEDAAVYRLGTRVRRTARSNTTSPTFTLPRGVNLTR